MLKKHKIICFMTVLQFVLFSGALAACTGNGTEAKPDSIQDQPIEIVSVKGPLEPINPGGPIVGITVKNISNNTIVSFRITLELDRTFRFEFDVSDTNPLLPNKTIYMEQILINGGFADDIEYPLEINGTFQDGNTFSYTEQVVIT
ncbi:MAG: hypothetical protein PHF74_05425 [Dehalococcoidales bacterium]|nr:hypothetical protein [Dehalococcoidales bacterium]